MYKRKFWHFEKWRTGFAAEVPHWKLVLNFKFFSIVIKSK